MAGGSRPGRGVNSVRLTTGGYCCGWCHSGGGGGVEGTGDGPSWLSFARKGKRVVALLTNGVTSVLSGELKPATFFNFYSFGDLMSAGGYTHCR